MLAQVSESLYPSCLHVAILFLTRDKQTYMFFDSGSQQTFLVDRVSASGRHLRRVLAVVDSTLILSKLDGIVTRMINISSITHLIFGASNGIRGGVLLLRIENERDLLLLHPAAAQGNVARQAATLIEHITEVRGGMHAGSVPLVVVERNDEQVIRAAADLARRGEGKPKSFPVTEQVLVPILFDDLTIPSDGPLVTDDVDLFVDSTFMNMLIRSVDLHPFSAHEAPRVTVEAPPPFRSLDISARFFSGFCRAYDAELPLVCNVHSHLPSITSFRAPKAFWVFVQRMLQVTRPLTSTLTALASDHIEAYVVGEEQYGVACTIKEWNDAIMQWELRVRSPEHREKKTKLIPKESDLFWQTFVSVLEAGAS